MKTNSLSFHHLPYWAKMVLLILILLIIGITTSAVGQDMNTPTKKRIDRAICILSPTEASQVTGIVTFTRTKEGIRIVANVKGLTPGKHGLHIHEYGNCQSPDVSAGLHFNPDGMPHNAPTHPTRHVGDLGNLFADPSGNAHLEFTNSKLSFKGSNSIIGRSVLVHQNEDDFVTQPSGNAGPCIACGIIGIDGG